MKAILVAVIFCVALTACKEKGDYKKFTADPLLYCKTVKKLNNAVFTMKFEVIK